MDSRVGNFGRSNGTWHSQVPRQRIRPILTCGEGRAKTKWVIHGPLKSYRNFRSIQKVCLWSFHERFEGLFEYMNAETESFGVGLHFHLVFDLVHSYYICIAMTLHLILYIRPLFVLQCVTNTLTHFDLPGGRKMLHQFKRRRKNMGNPA